MERSYFDKLTAQLKRENLDAILIAPSQDLRFLLGFVPMLCLRFQGLVVTAKGSCFYICNVLTADEIRPYIPGGKVYSWHDNDGFTETVRRAFQEHDLIGKRIGINNAVRAFNALEIMQSIDVTFVSAPNLCAELRICKTDSEMERMAYAAKISVEALKRTVPQIRTGMQEKEVQEILVGHLMDLGADYASALVASGPNSGFPHYNSNTRVLQRGDAVLIDFGCLYQGLCSDITRTFFLEEVSDHQREVYELVLQANKAAESALIQGVRWIPDIDRAARQVIEEGGYGPYFTTRLGHGIGYMPHEAPDIKANNKRSLEPRMAFTVEPGIYLREFGVRIEDCLIMDQEGHPVILSEGFPKECMIIGREGDMNS